MKKIIRALLPLSVLIFLIPTAGYSATSPLALDIFPPVQFPPDDFNVTGVRVSAILGDHRSVYGIDLAAIGNMTEQSFGGIGVSGLFNITHGTTTIVLLQAAGAANVNTQKTSVGGIQVAAVNYNSADSTVVGFQIGPVANISPHTKIYGFEVGLYNKAQEINGFQIGLLNFTQDLHGLQIGLLNFNERGLFRVCPFLNAGF